MPSPPPAIRRSSSFDDNYDEPEGDEDDDVPRNVSVPVGGRYGTRADSRPLPPEDNYENDEDDFPRRMSNPPPSLPPKRLSEKHTENKAPSVRAQPTARPVKFGPPVLPLKPAKVNSIDDGNAGMFLPPTLNPITVAKMQKLKGSNQNQKMTGSELFNKKKLELEKAIGNLN